MARGATTEKDIVMANDRGSVQFHGFNLYPKLPSDMAVNLQNTFRTQIMAFTRSARPIGILSRQPLKPLRHLYPRILRPQDCSVGKHKIQSIRAPSSASTRPWLAIRSIPIPACARKTKSMREFQQASLRFGTDMHLGNGAIYAVAKRADSSAALTRMAFLTVLLVTSWNADADPRPTVAADFAPCLSIRGISCGPSQLSKSQGRSQQQKSQSRQRFCFVQQHTRATSPPRSSVWMVWLEGAEIANLGQPLHRPTVAHRGAVGR